MIFNSRRQALFVAYQLATRETVTDAVPHAGFDDRGDRMLQWRVMVGDRPATDAECAPHMHWWDRLEDVRVGKPVGR